MLTQVEQLAQIISNSNKIVFFGGAGVSTESGIPDFRSVDGLYNQKYKYPPETILSHNFFTTNTAEFYDFYRDRMIYTEAIPNKAHYALAELEKTGKLKAVITQNIDGLHQMAGSKNVIELHGSVHRNFCMDCRKAAGLNVIMQSNGIPRCECGGIIKPDVVLYGEGLNSDDIRNALSIIQMADLLIIGGTSLEVYPASGLVQYFDGKNLVLINKSSTPMDNKSTLIINEKVGEVLGMVLGLQSQCNDRC